MAASYFDQFPKSKPDSLSSKRGYFDQFPVSADSASTPKPWMKDSGESFESAVGRTARTAGEKAIDLAPAIGGLGGSILGAYGGPLGSIEMAMLGGAGGEALRQNLRRQFGMDAPQNHMDALRGIGEQGALQGFNEAGGLTLNGVAKLTGLGLSKAALATSKKVNLEAINKELGSEGAARHPSITAIEKRLTVGAGVPATLERVATGKNRFIKPGGAAKAKNNLEMAEKVARGQRDAAPWYSVSDAADLYIKSLEKESGPLTQIEKDRAWNDIRERSNELLTARAGGVVQHNAARFSPEEVHRIIKEAHAAAPTDVSKISQGLKVASTNPNLDQRLAATWRDALTNDKTGIPGQLAAREDVKNAKVAFEAIKNAQASTPFRRGFALPAAVAGGAAMIPGEYTGSNRNDATIAFLVALASLNRQAESRAALALTDPVLQRILGQVPRFASNGAFFAPNNFPAAPDTTR